MRNLVRQVIYRPGAVELNHVLFFSLCASRSFQTHKIIEFNIRPAFQDVVETIYTAVVDIIFDVLNILRLTNIGTVKGLILAWVIF